MKSFPQKYFNIPSPFEISSTLIFFFLVARTSKRKLKLEIRGFGLNALEGKEILLKN